MRPSDDSPRQGASGMRHKTVFRVHCPVPGPSRSDPPRGPSRGRSTRFAAAMARVRRPVPFRTRKLRPCTAMVLHPRGCGRVARRRFHTIRFPPVEPPRAPGGILVFPRLHRIPSFRHSYLLIFIFIYIYSFIFIHSLPIRPSVLRGAPPARARRRRGTGPGGHGGLRGGPCMPPHGPRREVPDPHRGRGAPAGRPAAPGRAAGNGAIRVRRRGGRAGKQGRPQGVVPGLYR